jgi:hypothetical protein
LKDFLKEVEKIMSSFVGARCRGCGKYIHASNANSTMPDYCIRCMPGQSIRSAWLEKREKKEKEKKREIDKNVG